MKLSYFDTDSGAALLSEFAAWAKADAEDSTVKDALFSAMCDAEMIGLTPEMFIHNGLYRLLVKRKALLIYDGLLPDEDFRREETAVIAKLRYGEDGAADA